MSSERRKAANQANARLSTGPNTPEGKAAVRFNALRHGLLARDIVLPGEDADAFEELSNAVRAHLSPLGPIEELLVERVVKVMWGLRRFARAETALLYSRVLAIKVDRLVTEVDSYEETLAKAKAMQLGLTRITDTAAYKIAQEALDRVRHEQNRDQVLLGRVIELDAKEGDALGTLARYERSLERSLYKALEELRQLQDRRLNRPSPSISDAITVD